jgi:hypothetical protein
MSGGVVVTVMVEDEVGGGGGGAWNEMPSARITMAASPTLTQSELTFAI